MTSQRPISAREIFTLTFSRTPSSAIRAFLREVLEQEDDATQERSDPVRKSTGGIPKDCVFLGRGQVRIGASLDTFRQGFNLKRRCVHRRLLRGIDPVTYVCVCTGS